MIGLLKDLKSELGIPLYKIMGYMKYAFTSFCNFLIFLTRALCVVTVFVCSLLLLKLVVFGGAEKSVYDLATLVIVIIVSILISRN